ncbi:hypothetical protein VTL71DRAFT_2559 [Oculimacula yallundae]|uniref:Uncharacterized protein n=1 Tax=Oculimacula yallundae TaxID=86028 RepID=A0ABR4CBH0_9HELO
MNYRQILPDFGIKDRTSSTVVERGVITDHHDETVFVNLIIARDTEENRRTITGNTDIVVRACQYIIYASRNLKSLTKEHATTAPDPATFQTLAM